MRIVLADTHGPILGKDQPAPNLSLLYLAAYARAAIPDLEFKYLPQRASKEDHLTVIEQWKPDVYALSFTSYGKFLAYELTQQARSASAKPLVVCGGAHASACPEETLRNSEANIVVIGEGEESFVQILRAHGQSGFVNELKRISGIAFFDHNKFCRTPERRLIPDLDDIPFPAWDLVDQNDYTGVSFSKGHPNTEMIITRGCPYRCTFCANPVFRVNGPSYRKRSPESIAEEVEFLYQKGYREIFFHSDELNVQHQWSVDVCKALAGLNHPDLFFQTNLRVAPMSEEFAYWLKQANFWMIRIGIESANLRVLKGTLKKMSLDQTEYACDLLSQNGIKVWGYFLLFQFWEEGAKLEVESAEEIRNSQKFAFRLWRENKLHYSSWAPAMPVPGAEFYNLAVRRNMIDEGYIPSDSNWDPRPHLDSVSNLEYRELFIRARALQMLMALSSGAIEWRNWRAILHRAKPLLRGKA